jgi:hypothetical protein
VTPELRRGDAVHMALPAVERNAGESVQDYDRRARLENDMAAAVLGPQYEALGVRVAVWSAHTGLALPTIVAVFRGADTAEPHSWLCCEDAGGAS